jgi:hypothetical protein
VYADPRRPVSGAGQHAGLVRLFTEIQAVLQQLGYGRREVGEVWLRDARWRKVRDWWRRQRRGQ